jgi:UDP-N-acetylmuramoyl-L-alanyl-D-glutamate--2,6-diaminopimelate ligase
LLQGCGDRPVHDGDLFFCLDGPGPSATQAAHAVRGGAAAICSETPLDVPAPQLLVDDVRVATARVADEFYGNPGRSLRLIGITGTDGKTTTSYLLFSMLRATGGPVGMISTVETRYSGVRRPSWNTTPPSIDLHRTFADMVRAGVGSVVLEVSSHAIALARVEGLRFERTVFTNLSPEHLAFHRDMNHLFATKAALFTPRRTLGAIVNQDDPYGRRLRHATMVPTLSYGVARDAEVRLRHAEHTAAGMVLFVDTPQGMLRLTTTLTGRWNVWNCLAACAAAGDMGLTHEQIEEGISGLAMVPGRFERVQHGQPFDVIVDYAHTARGLQMVLQEVRRVARRRGGRVLCVFGCGGERDRAKRPLMGAVAARPANFVVVTSDNPRGEDPEAIIREILQGIVTERAAGPDAVTPDRREAIGIALGTAARGDIVVVAGKGHEGGQELADRIVPFDDREVAARALEALGWEAAPCPASWSPASSV